MEQEIFLTPAEKMRHIRNVVNNTDASEQDPALILATYFSRLDTLREHIAILEGKTQLREKPFVSYTPVIGVFIVRFRTLWNWLSTKWYILPIMKQQNDFNKEIVGTLREILVAVESLTSSVTYIQSQVIEASDEENKSFPLSGTEQE